MDQTLYSLLLLEARFLLGAEIEQATRMRELAESITDERLRALFAAHAQETDGQVERLHEVLSAFEEDGDADVPAAVDGLIEDAEMMADMELGQPMQDVAITAAARKMEHYEIASYEAVISIAEKLELQDVLDLLRQTLEEERRAEQQFAILGSALLQDSVEIEAE